jgi:hypothetical protein
MIKLEEYGVEKRVIKNLQYAYPKLEYMDQLCELTNRELYRVPLFGKKTVGYLMGLINQYRAENKIEKLSEIDDLRNRVSVLESMLLKLMNEKSQ